VPKTVISPCMGIGKIVASVTRRAAYHVQGQCPEDVELLSIPALIAGDPHERELIQNNPAIVIDGCALRCGAHIFKLFGVEPAAKIEVAQIMKERKVGPGKTRKELEEVGKRLSNFTAERVLEALKDGLVAEGFEPVEELQHEVPAIADCGDAILRSCAASNPTADGGETPPRRTFNPQSAIRNPQSSDVEACPVGPAGEVTSSGKYKVNSVTILPCQGIKRSGGRVTQRAAYHVVEDRYLGKTHLLCISALAAGVQEDVDMLEQYPTIAINGCGKNCASIAAEHYGIPAAAAVNLHEVDASYPCEEKSLTPDLTDNEAAAALKLADAVSVEMEKLIGKEIEWQPGKINLHGLVHEASTINKTTGYADPGTGFLVKLAKYQQMKAEQTAQRSDPSPYPLPQGEGKQQSDAPSLTRRASDDGEVNASDPAVKNYVANLFKPKPRMGGVSK